MNRSRLVIDDSFPENQGAFTLVELLVVMSILVVLASLILPAVNSAQQQGKLARELSSAKQLMVAYHLYATES